MPMSIAHISHLAGGLITFIISIMILTQMRKLRARVKGINVWYFIYWFVLATVIYALAHAIGDLAEAIFLSIGAETLWEDIMPVSEAVESITYLIMFVLILVTARSIRAFSEEE